MAEFSLAGLKQYFQPVLDAARAPPQSTGADYPERGLAALGAGLAHTASVPGRLMAPNPWPEGSEQWDWYESTKRRDATSWAPEMALNMIGAPAMGGVSAGGREAVLGSGAVRRSALPMDEASRLERARSQGYNTNEPVYHETARSFNEFKPEYGSQVWFTTDKGTLGQNGAAGQGRVIEAYLNNKKLAGWPEYDKYGTDELVRMGYDGARLGKDIVTFNPKGIRSVDAKFDPKKIKSGNILAGAAGLAAPLAGIAALRPQQD